MKAMIFIYVSILTDIDRSRVLDLVPERKLEAAKSLLETLSPTQRTSVKKETFVQFWGYRYRGAAKRFFDACNIIG